MPVAPRSIFRGQVYLHSRRHRDQARDSGPGRELRASIQNTDSTRPLCGSVAALIATAALLGGEADVISTSGPALINARLMGTPVLYVTNFNNWSDAHLLVRPEVTSMEQLRGGKICCTGAGRRLCAHAARILFPKYGLDQGAKTADDPLGGRYVRPLWPGS